MRDKTTELAESKLLLLYIINKIDLPISNNQITQIVLENNLLNYFTFQQYLNELISSNCLTQTEKSGKNRLIMTKEGKNVLELFKDRISQNKQGIIDEYLKQFQTDIAKALTVTADYDIEGNNDYIVDLKVIENNSLLLNVKLNVASNEQAKAICRKWNENPSKYYSEIISLFANE